MAASCWHQGIVSCLDMEANYEAGCLFCPHLARFSLCLQCKDILQDITGSFLYAAHLAFSEVCSSSWRSLVWILWKQGSQLPRKGCLVWGSFCHATGWCIKPMVPEMPQATEVMVDSELAAVCWVMLWNGCGCHIVPVGPGSHGVAGVGSDILGL